MSDTEWEAYALSAGVTPEQVQGILAHADKPGSVEEIRRAAAGVRGDRTRWACSDYVEFDPEVIRGLDYYTGIVFEAQARAGRAGHLWRRALR